MIRVTFKIELNHLLKLYYVLLSIFTLEEFQINNIKSIFESHYMQSYKKSVK